MKVELLYFDDCPNYEGVLSKVRALVAEAAPAAEVALRRIRTVEQAEAERFLGSPTVRVDGIDVDPGARGRNDFGLKCRLYRAGKKTLRAPPDEWLRAALRQR